MIDEALGHLSVDLGGEIIERVRCPVLTLRSAF